MVRHTAYSPVPAGAGGEEPGDGHHGSGAYGGKLIESKIDQETDAMKKKDMLHDLNDIRLCKVIIRRLNSSRHREVVLPSLLDNAGRKYGQSRRG